MAKKSKVSLFTLGTMETTESFDKMYKMTKYAYYSGINHIETASSYGDAEILIGKALKELEIVDKIEKKIG